MLDKKSIEQIREALQTSKNPLFFFDDDPDGLCSFLLLYRFVREGHGVIVKGRPSLDAIFLKKVEEYHPDKIFIVDVPVVEQEFIDKANVEVIWIDHHNPVDRSKVRYFNPRVAEAHDSTCITRICFEVSQQDRWIAAVGSIADWQIPEWFEDFRKESPGLVGSEKEIGDIYFNSTLGRLIRIFSFILKGKTSDVNKCFKVLTRIDSPQEILQHETSRGKFLYKKFEVVNEEYRALLAKAAKTVPKENFLIFFYQEDETSFTSDLSNELKHLFPSKVIIVGRQKGDEVRMSLRCEFKELDKAVAKALVGIEGYGGGHEHACGANVKKADFERFLENLKRELKV